MIIAIIYGLGVFVTAGILYQLAAAWLTMRALAAAAPLRPGGEGVSILKPLHGPEPRLAANLVSFAVQDYPGPVEIICGVQRLSDPAIGVVEAWQAQFPASFVLVTDPTGHGRNAKISNLINMIGSARHDIIILSDSDMAAGPDYLARITTALAAPGVGAVTCLYHGRGDAGPWSRLAAMAISHGFLPSVAFGMALGLARPCMGSTIALRRETLDAIGGLPAFANVLADDHAIGMAVRSLGLTVAVPGFTIAHACTERSLAEVVAHELRWNLTIRRLDPIGFIGHGLVNPLPLALLAMTIAPVPITIFMALGAYLARIIVATSIDGACQRRSEPLAWLPARDLLTFALFLASFAVSGVDWRGRRLDIGRDGRIAGAGR